MIVYTTCNPLNFPWAPFSLKEPPNLLDYYKLDCNKLENMKIRRLPAWSGSCLIKIRPGLIGQVAAWSKPGSCLIDWAAARSKSGSRLTDLVATMIKLGSCLTDQAAARLKSGSFLIDQDPGSREVYGLICCTFLIFRVRRNKWGNILPEGLVNPNRHFSRRAIKWILVIPTESWSAHHLISVPHT